MKAKDADTRAALARLDSRYRAYLIFGQDEGLVRERAKKIAKLVLDDPDDPFNAARLSGATIKNDPARLADEFGAMSLMGGRRLVWFEGAEDGHKDAVSGALEQSSGDNILVIAAGDLATKSSLRKLCEDARDVLAIACYRDNAQDVGEVIREVIGAAGLRLDPDAAAFLQASLGGDRGITRSELEKLVLYKADEPGGTITLDDAETMVGDSSAFNMGDIAAAVTGGKMKDLDRLLEKAATQGEEPIGILRILAKRLENMHRVLSDVKDGGSMDESVRRLRLFFRDEPIFKAQLRQWSPDRLAQAMALVQEAEADCKTTGMPAAAVMGRTLLRIGASVARQRG